MPFISRQKHRNLSGNQAENMAEQNASIENLVRRILNSVQELPQQTSSASFPEGAASRRSESVNLTTTEEVNRRFNIPRGAPSANSSTSPVVSLAQQYNPSQNYGYTNYNANNTRFVTFIFVKIPK